MWSKLCCSKIFLRFLNVLCKGVLMLDQYFIMNHVFFSSTFKVMQYSILYTFAIGTSRSCLKVSPSNSSYVVLKTSWCCVTVFLIILLHQNFSYIDYLQISCVCYLEIFRHNRCLDLYLSTAYCKSVVDLSFKYFFMISCCQPMSMTRWKMFVYLFMWSDI